MCGNKEKESYKTREGSERRYRQVSLASGLLINEEVEGVGGIVNSTLVY